MRQTMASASITRQAVSRDLPSAAGSRVRDLGPDQIEDDLMVDLFNEAIESSTWKGRSEALAVKMGIDRGYLSKVRSKEKPLNLKIIRSLPDDVEAIYSGLYAEAFGQIVVPPPPDERTAARHLVSGLLGLFGGRLAASAFTGASRGRR